MSFTGSLANARHHVPILAITADAREWDQSVQWQVATRAAERPQTVRERFLDQRKREGNLSPQRALSPLQQRLQRKQRQAGSRRTSKLSPFSPFQGNEPVSPMSPQEHLSADRFASADEHAKPFSTPLSPSKADQIDRALAMGARREEAWGQDAGWESLWEHEDEDDGRQAPGANSSPPPPPRPGRGPPPQPHSFCPHDDGRSRAPRPPHHQGHGSLLTLGDVDTDERALARDQRHLRMRARASGRFAAAAGGGAGGGKSAGRAGERDLAIRHSINESAPSSEGAAGSASEDEVDGGGGRGLAHQDIAMTSPLGRANIKGRHSRFEERSVEALAETSERGAEADTSAEPCAVGRAGTWEEEMDQMSRAVFEWIREEEDRVRSRRRTLRAKAAQRFLSTENRSVHNWGITTPGQRGSFSSTPTRADEL